MFAILLFQVDPAESIAQDNKRHKLCFEFLKKYKMAFEMAIALSGLRIHGRVFRSESCKQVLRRENLGL